MKNKSTSQSAFFNLRVLIASVLCLAGVAIAMLATGAFSTAFAQTKGSGSGTQDAPGTQTPDVVRLVGPVRLNQNLRDLPYIPNERFAEEQQMTRYPHGGTREPAAPFPAMQSLITGIFQPIPNMPPPLLT